MLRLLESLLTNLQVICCNLFEGEKIQNHGNEAITKIQIYILNNSN